MKEIATFAGGCFWCLEHDLREMKGVLSVTSGYTGGTKENPTYHEVCGGTTGHVEAVQVTFDPTKLTYRELLDQFWHHIDPTRNDGQFCDIGAQYRPLIFYHSIEQKKIAEDSKQELIESGKFPSVMVDILAVQPFFSAEEYHQNYSSKNPLRYSAYRYASGRDNTLRELWGEERAQ